MTTYIPHKFIRRVPVEEWRDPDDHGYRSLKCLGVSLDHIEPPCRIPDRLYLQIDDALSAKAQADGVNVPVALDPAAWLLRCRRCHSPFIGSSEAKMCSDACRTLAKRDSIRRASAKRAKRRAEASKARESACRHCGQRLPARRSTKRFCSVGCRVAAHRGAPATYVVEWPDIGETPEAQWRAWGKAYAVTLDRKIDDNRSILGAAQAGYLDAATVKALIERGVALQAERDKLKAEHQAESSLNVPALAPAPRLADNPATPP